MIFRLTRPAIKDLAEIGKHTRKEWGDEQSKKYQIALSTRLKWLCRNKPLWRERPELQEGIYTYNEHSHIIVFLEYENGIEILRILHQRMDPVRHLSKP